MKYSRIIKILEPIARDIIPVANAKIASAMIYKRKIIAFGCCCRKTHPFQAKYGRNNLSIYFHSETMCIYNTLKVLSIEDMKQCILFSIRLKANGSFGMAKPCAGCESCINMFKLKDALYSTDDGILTNITNTETYII